MNVSLYTAIGEEAAIDAAVDLFYRKILQDPAISHFFDNTDMEEQRAKQKAFLTMVMGGPNEYTGKEMREAHQALVEKGLNDSHFDAVAGHLQSTLEELKVEPVNIGQVMAAVAGTRDDVLNR